MKPRTPKTKIQPAQVADAEVPELEFSPEAAERTIGRLVKRNLPGSTAAERLAAYDEVREAVGLKQYAPGVKR